MEYRRQLSGWQAAVVGAAILGFITYQCVSRIQSVDPAGRDAIRGWLVRQYEGKGIRQEVQAYLRHKAGEVIEPAPPPAPAPDVRIVSLTAHGSRDIMVVQVRVSVNDGAPPDGRPLRYLYLDRQSDGRWVVFGESDALHYYWMLLLPAFSRSVSIGR